MDTEPSMKLDIGANKDSECMTSEHVSTNRANCISNASAKVPLTTTLQLPYFDYRFMKLSSLIDNFLRLLIVAEYVQELQTMYIRLDSTRTLFGARKPPLFTVLPRAPQVALKNPKSPLRRLLLPPHPPCPTMLFCEQSFLLSNHMLCCPRDGCCTDAV